MIKIEKINEDNVKLYKDGRLVYDSLHPRHEWKESLTKLSGEERRKHFEEIEALYN